MPLAVLWCPSLSVAAVLDLDELLLMERHLACRQNWQFGSAARFERCLSEWGASDPEWDKDLDARIDEADHRLAYLEYWDQGSGEQICYLQSGAVVPIVDCEPCEVRHAAAECVDDEGDGVALWQELALGTSDSQPTPGCDTGLDCGGFNETCRLGTAPAVEEPRECIVVNGVPCLPRACVAAGDCTVSHLEEVAQDNQQALVHVHFDHAPVLW